MNKRYVLINLPVAFQKKIFLVISALVTFTIPLKPSYNSIGIIILLVYWLLFLPKSFNKGRIRFILMISALFWVALIAMGYTQNINEGLFRLQQKSILFVIPLIFGTIDFDWQREFRWIVSLFIITAVIASLVCLGDGFMYFVRNDSTERFFSDGLVEFINLYPYIMALICLVAILIISEASLNKIELHNWLHQPFIAAGLLIFFSLMIFLLSVKQIILAWMAFFVINALRMKARKSVALFLIVCSFIILIASVFFIPTLNRKVKEVFYSEENNIPLDRDASLGRDWNGIALRKAIWTCTLDVIKSNFIVGVGTGDGQDTLQAAYENRMFYFASRHNLYNAHNQYLQTMVNFGVIGLFIWMFSLYSFWKTFRRHWLIVNLIGCFMFAMLTESMLETNKGILLMAFCCSIIPFADPLIFNKGHQDIAWEKYY